ncbi:TetR/AcrR family transcriptional regulator [Amycolatopsis lurida]
MPRTAQQYEALRNASRDVVLTCAVRVFAQRGYAAASMRDIAREAGLSVGLIYRHYPTKDELFADVLDRAVTGLDEAARELTSADDGYAVLCRFIERYLAGIAADDGAAEFSMVLNQAFLSDEPAGARTGLLAGHRRFRRGLETAISRAQRDGHCAAGEAEAVAAVLLSLLSGAVTMRMALGAAAVPRPGTVVHMLDGGAR